MIRCDECDEIIENGDEAYVFSDDNDTYYFCCAVCAADFLCEVEEVYDEDDEDEDEDFDEDEEEEVVDFNIFG